MEQTIKINCPEGKKAVYNEETQTIDFVDIEPIRSKSWEEFCKNHPIESDTEWCIDGSRISPAYAEIKSREATFDQAKGYLATKKDAEGILALIQLTRLHDEWVGDWKPDYDNKKMIWFIDHVEFKCGYSFDIKYTEYTSHLLSFPNSKMCMEFLNCFKDLIEKAKRFI